MNNIVEMKVYFGSISIYSVIFIIAPFVHVPVNPFSINHYGSWRVLCVYKILYMKYHTWNAIK